MEIVINVQFGGFSLSLLAIKEYLKLKEKDVFFYKMEIEDAEINYKKVDENLNETFVSCFIKDFGEVFKSNAMSNEEWEKYSLNSRNIKRTDKDLIKVVKKLGKKANTVCSTLKIIEIPNDVDWIIEEYDGNEWVAEKHRTWR